MATLGLDNIFKIFNGAEPSASELAQLRNDVMFMALARATSADPIISSTIGNMSTMKAHTSAARASP